MYYFEYDKDGYLVKYAETKNEIVYSAISVSNSFFYCVAKDNLVTKFEENGFFKTVSKYNGPIKLTQSFSEGESWVKVLNKKTILKEDDVNEKENFPNVSSYKETNYPWITYNEEKSLENCIKEYVGDMDDYALPVSVLSLEGESLSHLNFKVKDSFLDKWNNLIDF